MKDWNFKFVAIWLTLSVLLGMLPVAAQTDNPKNSPLYGKTVLFGGDSIAAGFADSPQGRGWAGRIGDAYSMEADNQANSGWAVSTIRGGSRMITQLQRVNQNTYDYVILHGGVNDAWGNDTEVAEPGEISSSYNPKDFDVSTYAGALEELFAYAITNFPGTVIGYIINFATPGCDKGRTADMEAYYAQAIQICQKWEIPYLDMYHDDYVNNTLLEVKTYNRYMADAVHPNAAGYDRLAPYVAAWMETLTLHTNSSLYGKTGLFCGDSISYGTADSPEGRAWAGRLAIYYGMKAENQSVGGYSLSTIRGGRIIDQLNKAKERNYDYVILHGGVNDAWGSVDGTTRIAPVGEMTDSYDPADFDVDTFAGGLEELFYYAMTRFPQAKIGFICNFAMPRSSQGVTRDMGDYFATAKQVCEKWGVHCLDMYNDTYVTEELLKVAVGTYVPDSIHPNAAGYDRLTPYIAEWMETMPENTAVWRQMRGDIDGDRSVNAVDALLILQAAVGKAALTDIQSKAADLNGDKAINATDALIVLQIAVGKA